MSHDADQRINNPYSLADYLEIYGADWVKAAEGRHLKRVAKIKAEGDPNDESYKWRAVWAKSITTKKRPLPSWDELEANHANIQRKVRARKRDR